MTRAAGSIDFAAGWRAWLEGAADPRLDPAADLEFWDRHAAELDTWHQPFASTLEALAGRVEPTDTLLDVGAGSGRFALPLAARCRSVTALDQSRALLDVIERKAAAAGATNIELLQTTWDEAAVPPHDVVLAAWSLYRQVDLNATLARLIEATRRLLVIVMPDADASQRARGETAAYLYILGALRELGVRAELTLIEEPQPAGGTIVVPLITWDRTRQPLDGDHSEVATPRLHRPRRPPPAPRRPPPQ